MEDRNNIPDLRNLVVTELNIEELYQLLLNFSYRISDLESKISNLNGRE